MDSVNYFENIMQIIEIDTTNSRQVKRFLELPFQVYRSVPQWVPPLAMDARKILDRRRYPFYQHSEAAFFMALTDSGSPVGRIAILNNKNYNTFNLSRSAFFYLFECKDNLEAAQGLFESGITWSKNRNLTEIIGPKGFTALDGFGLLVKGFEHRPALGIPYNPPYYINLIERNGFKSIGETVSGYLENGVFQLPENIHNLAQLVQKRRGFRIERFTSNRDLRDIVPKLHSLYNTSLDGTSGTVPLTNAEVKSLADQMLWFADPSLIKIISKEGEPVGFVFAYPDISAALQRTKGHLFPFGWLDILIELRRTRWMNINGAGIIEKYRGLGGTAILFSELYNTVSESRYKFVDIVQIGVENGNMQREMRDLGIDFYKTHRVYRRDLAS